MIGVDDGCLSVVEWYGYGIVDCVIGVGVVCVEFGDFVMCDDCCVEWLCYCG